MSLSQRVLDYLNATFANWYAELGIFLLVLAIALKIFGENKKLFPLLSILDQSRRIFLWICFVIYIVANFQAYDDMRAQRDQVRAKLNSGEMSPEEFSDLLNKLPTSINGLKRGQVWNDGGVIAIAR